MNVYELLNIKRNCCIICNKSFTAGYLLRYHVLGAHGPKFECNLCGKIISNYKNNIVRHNKIYHDF